MKTLTSLTLLLVLFFAQGCKVEGEGLEPIKINTPNDTTVSTVSLLAYKFDALLSGSNLKVCFSVDNENLDVQAALSNYESLIQAAGGSVSNQVSVADCSDDFSGTSNFCEMNVGQQSENKVQVLNTNGTNETQSFCSTWSGTYTDNSSSAPSDCSAIAGTWSYSASSFCISGGLPVSVVKTFTMVITNSCEETTSSSGCAATDGVTTNCTLTPNNDGTYSCDTGTAYSIENVTVGASTTFDRVRTDDGSTATYTKQ